MTRPPPPEDLRSPEVQLPPVIACSAGSGAAVNVSVRHRGSEPALLTITVLGLDARWVPEPVVIGPLDPGETTTIALTLVPERGALGARYPFVVAIEATTRQGEPPVMGIAESVLAVDTRERIAVAIVPSISSAVFGRKVEVQVTNPGQEDRELQLESTHAGGASLRLADTSILVPAGRTGTVRGRIKVRHPRFLGSGAVHTVGVTARSTAAPEFAEASLRSRPVIRTGLRAAVAVGLVLALWVAAAIIFIPKLSDRFTAKNSVPTAGATSTAPTSGAGGTGANGAEGNGTGGTGAPGTGTGGTGTGGTGSGGTGAGGPSTGGPGAPGAAGGSGSGNERLIGAVTGPGANGVIVVLQPTSLAGGAAVGATPTDQATANGLRAASGPFGKVPEAALQLSRDDGCSNSQKMTTTSDGAFAFGCIFSPGFYLLSLARKGFGTQRYIVNAATLADADPLEVSLIPGDGTLFGAVTGPDGPVGAATVAITDGTVALSTSTVSAGGQGTAGSWTVDGLSTPDTYLVTVSAPGLGTSSQLIELPAKGRKAANLTLHRGVAAISGTVSGTDELGVDGGLGGVTVSATDGATTRTATTVTTGVVGSYALPDLPAPGEYTLTVTGTGFSTQTRTVTIPRDVGGVTADVSLSRSNGGVTGIVRDGTSRGQGLPAVGLTLTGKDTAYKTMSLTDPLGRYSFTGVVPGTYVLTAQLFGRKPLSVPVTVVAAAGATANLVLLSDQGASTPRTSFVVGTVTDARSGAGLKCDRSAAPTPDPNCVVTVTGTIPGVSKPVSSTGTANAYTWPDPERLQGGLPAGLYDLTLTAPGFETVTVRVSVPENNPQVPAQQVAMQPLGVIAGTVTPKIGSPRPGSPTCAVAVVGIGTTTSGCVLSKNNTQCTVQATAAARCVVVASSGKYTILGLTHGSYQVSFIPTDPEYLSTDPRTVQVDFGADVVVDAALDRYGRMTLTVLAPDLQTGALRPAKDADVVIAAVKPEISDPPTPTPPTARPDTGKTAADGTFATVGLLGNYSVQASGFPGQASVQTGEVGLNQTLQVTIALTRSIGVSIGRVTTTVDGATVPVGNAVVTVSGIIGYLGSTPIIGSAKPTTDDNGCYAVVPDGWTAAAGPAVVGLGCPDPAGGALPTVGAGQTPGPDGRPPAVAVAKDTSGKRGSLAALRVDLTVDATDTRTEPFTAENIVIGDPEKPPPYGYALRAVPEILVAAKPSVFGTHTLSTSRAPIQGRIVDWSNLIFTVTKKPAGSGAVTVTRTASGTLTFRDSSQAADDQVVPGRYEVDVSLVGFASTSFVVTCDLGTTCVLTQSGTDTVADQVVLFELAAITGVITADKPAPGVTASQAQVTVVTVPSNAGLVTVTVTADLSNQGVIGVRDANLFPALAVPGIYVFSVALKGYATQLITVTCGEDYRTGCTSDASTDSGALSPVMKRLPEFAGTVTLSPQTLPSGVRVSPDEIKVVIVSQSNPSVSATVTVLDDQDDPANPADRIGHLVWNDTALPSNIIMPGDYTLQLSRKGYETITAPFTCDVQAATCGPPAITMRMLPQGAGTVTVPAPPGGESPAFTAPGVVSFTGPGGTSSLKISLEPNPRNANQATLGWNDTAVGIPGLTQPGEYVITIEVPGYQPDSETITCISGTVCAPTFAPTLQPSFRGQANLAPPRGTFPPLANAKFTVTGSTGTVLLAADADGNLTWQETGWPKNLVREGSYQITGTLAGFEMPPTPFTCDGPTTCTLTGITFYEPSQLRVVITGGSPAVPVVGAQMTLSGNTIPDIPANAGSSDRITFGAMSTLPTSTYTLTVVAAGYAQTDLGPDSPADNVTCGPEFGQAAPGLKLSPGGTTVCTVILSPIGTIVGHVRGRTQLTVNPATYTYSDLQGVSVSACRVADPVATSADCVAGGPTFTGVSGPGGIVRITGTSANPGLLAGTWRVTASGVGFQRTTGSVVITAAFQMASANPPRTDALIIDGALGQALIDLPVQAVTLQIKPQSFGTPVLPAGTYVLTGANGTATCVVPTDPCAFPTGPPGGPAVPMIRLTGINPGTYNLKATPANPENPEFVPIEQVVVVQIPTTSNLLTQDAPINLFLRSSTLRITVSRPAPGTGPDPWTANSSVALVDANTGLPAEDLDGNPLQGPLVPTGTDRLAAGIAFARVHDGFYKAQIVVPGYTPILSGSIQMWAAVSPTPPPVPFTLVRATRTVNLTLSSTAASTTGGPPADLVGAAIAFQQISTIGSAPPDTGSYTATAGPGGYVTAPQLPTGTWRAVVTGSQTGGPISTESAFRPRSTEFDVPDPTLANADALTRSATVAQGRAMFALSWPKTSCSSIDSPTTSVTVQITRTDVAPDVSTTISAAVTSTATAYAAAGSVYLPPGQYEWATTGLPAGWDQSLGPKTFTITVAGNAAAGSVAPVTETDTLAPATVPVTVTMQVDSADFPGVTVTASRATSPTTSSPISGGTATLCLQPVAGWSFSVGSATVRLPDQTQTITPAGPNTVPFVGFSLIPSAQLAAVAGRTADSRAVTITVRQGGTAVWSATPSPNLTGTATYTGPKLVLPTGSYTLRATPPIGDEFGEVTSAAVAVATAHTVDVTLPYVRAMFTVTVTADGAPAGAATVVLSDGGGTKQTNAAGQALFADLPTGSYDITATKGTRTGIKTVAVPVGTSGTSVALGPALGGKAGQLAGRGATEQTTADQPAPSTAVPPPATSLGQPIETIDSTTTARSTPTTTTRSTPATSRPTTPATPTPPAASPTATAPATAIDPPPAP